MLPKINAFWRVPLILLATAVLATLSVAASLVDGTGRWQHACARAWGRFIFWVSRVRVKTRGLDNVDTSRGYVFMANHLSMFDHWAFLAVVPVQFRFVAKGSLFRIPFLGWHLRRAGNIPVDREVMQAILGFFALFMGVFVFASFLMAASGMDLVSAGAAVIATLSNIGPGLGSVGPTDNYAHVSQFGKSVLMICMLLGRLELFTVLVLIFPTFWRK